MGAIRDRLHLTFGLPTFIVSATPGSTQILLILSMAGEYPVTIEHKPHVIRFTLQVFRVAELLRHLLDLGFFLARERVSGPPFLALANFQTRRCADGNIHGLAQTGASALTIGRLDGLHDVAQAPKKRSFESIERLSFRPYVAFEHTLPRSIVLTDAVLCMD